MKWSFFSVWNESLEKRAERAESPRLHMWASELGKAHIDRYLKMSGVKPTNPPNSRSLRKFEAGNIWEWIVGLVLKRAGILVEAQKWVKYQYPGLLEVTGKIDYLAGGKPNWEKARDEIEKGEYPDFIKRAAEGVINHLSEKFPNGLDIIPLEIKSTGQFMFEKYEKYQASDPTHRLQLFHYLKANDMPEGHIVYICKDDCRMLELAIDNPSVVEDEYKKDIQEMTYYIKNRIQPEKESEVVWMPDTFRFAANWKVEYSNYLTMLYGYKDPMEFREKMDRQIASWNRVFNRVVKGDNMTKMNLEVIELMKKDFPKFDELVDSAKSANASSFEEEMEETNA